MIDGDDPSTSYIMKKWEVENTGVFYHAEISGSIVAAAVVHATQATQSHQIVFLNTLTGETVPVDSPNVCTYQPKIIIRSEYPLHRTSSAEVCCSRCTRSTLFYTESTRIN